MIGKIQHTGCDHYSGKVNEKENKMGISQKSKSQYNAKIEEEEKKTTGKEKKDDVALSSYKRLKSDSEIIRSYIEEQREVVKKRIKDGEEGPKIRIGAKEMTRADWDKLLKKVDDQLNKIHEQIEKEEKILDEKKKQQKMKERKQLEKQITKKWQEQHIEEKHLQEKRVEKRLEEKRKNEKIM